MPRSIFPPIGYQTKPSLETMVEGVRTNAELQSDTGIRDIRTASLFERIMELRHLSKNLYGNRAFCIPTDEEIIRLAADRLGLLLTDIGPKSRSTPTSSFEARFKEEETDRIERPKQSEKQPTTADGSLHAIADSIFERDMIPEVRKTIFLEHFADAVQKVMERERNNQ